MKKFLLASLLSTTLFATGYARAGDNKTGFINRVFDKDKAKYVLFIPHNYDSKKSWPVIMFLHGSGETGTDGLRQVKVGLGPAIKKREKSFPFVAVFPQSQKRTWRAESDDAKRAMAILDQTIKEYNIDKKRIYLTGLSMGGYGTWSLAVAHPDKWAAIAPVCGGGEPSKAAKIAKLPCWCFHGDKDKAVSVKKSRAMIEALKSAKSEPRYTEYPGVGHNSWDRAYGTDELYVWLLTNRVK